MRWALSIILLLVLFGSLAGVKAAQIGALISHGKQAAAQGPPPETVATAVAAEAKWQGTQTEVGSVAASRGVTVSNASPGLVRSIHFESGQTVKSGALLVEIDADVERSQLAAAAARQTLAATTLERTRALVATGSLAQAQLDADEAAFATAQKDASALRAEIARKEVRAPFAGRLGIRGVNVGQYLAAGTPITVLESVTAVFVDFTTPQERLAALAEGMPVQVSVVNAGAGKPDGAAPRTGAIVAIEPTVDATSRTARVRASVPNEDESLRPGMFVNVTVLVREEEHVVIVPATCIVHASFGDSVFIVENKTARQQFVRTGTQRGDFVAIVEGVKPGQEIVSAGAFKLRNAMPVVVDNSTSAHPQIDPRPENR